MQRLWFGCAVVGLALAIHSVDAGPPVYPSATVTQARSGTSQKFGKGSITHRNDGSHGQQQPFGSGAIHTETTPSGRNLRGQTQPFGNGTITRWSDGTTVQTRPFGNGTLITERRPDGTVVRGQSSPFGRGEIIRRSDGSTSQVQPFGNGTITRDQPGRRPPYTGPLATRPSR